MTRKHRTLFYILIMLIISSTPASADVGVPMICVVYPYAWILLIPVILIEAIAAIRICKVSLGAALKVSSIANLISTLVGIPLTWAMLVIFQLMIGGGGAHGLSTVMQKIYAVTIQSPWLIPYEDDLHWMVPAASAALCIPFFLMSIWCEYLVGKRYFTYKEQPAVERWAWIANAFSYGFLIAFLLYNVITNL